MLNTHPLTADQAHHLDEAAAFWDRRSELLVEKRSLLGGLQWKTLGGREYLYRYQPDPISRKKRSTSIGRRSSDTERFFADFMQRRELVNASLARAEEEGETLARFSKALRLAKVPHQTGQILELIWEAGLSPFLILHSEEAAFAYEAILRWQLPSPHSGRLAFLFSDDTLARELAQSLSRCLVQIDETYEFDLAQMCFRGTRGPEVSVSRRSDFVDQAEGWDDTLEEHREALVELLEMPPVTGLPITRSGYPVPMTVVDPRAFVFERLFSVAPDDTFGLSIIAALHDNTDFQFEPHHLEMLPGDIDDAWGSDRRLTPRI